MSTFPDKTCTHCKTPKPASREFFKPLKLAKDGLSSWCRTCTSEDSKRAHRILKLNPIALAARRLQLRNAHLKRKYGVTGMQYDEMLVRQGGRCGICDATPDPVFYVDHDHETNQIRGLLCHNCNTLLGNAKDDVEVLFAAIGYLQQSCLRAVS